MIVASPRGPRFECCVGGWRYQDPYGWVVCGHHEDVASKNGQPSDYFIGWFQAWQP